MTTESARPHNRLTRLFHLSVAVLVISQVATSQFMTTPGKNREEDWLFEIHEFTGIALINQFAGKQPLSDLWSLKKD